MNATDESRAAMQGYRHGLKGLQRAASPGESKNYEVAYWDAWEIGHRHWLLRQEAQADEGTAPGEEIEEDWLPRAT